MKPSRFVPNLIISVLLLTGTCAALSTLPGCAQVAPGGVYQGDSFLFQAEQATVTGKQILDVFLTFEYNNRKSLSVVPGVTKAADRIRAGAPRWFETAHSLHDVYMSDPSQANRDALQKALDVINQAVKEALGYLATYGPNR